MNGLTLIFKLAQLVIRSETPLFKYMISTKSVIKQFLGQFSN